MKRDDLDDLLFWVVSLTALLLGMLTLHECHRRDLKRAAESKHVAPKLWQRSDIPRSELNAPKPKPTIALQGAVAEPWDVVTPSGVVGTYPPTSPDTQPWVYFHARPKWEVRAERELMRMRLEKRKAEADRVAALSHE